MEKSLCAFFGVIFGLKGIISLKGDQFGWANLVLGLDTGGGQSEGQPPSWQTLGAPKILYHHSPALHVNNKRRYGSICLNDTLDPGPQLLTPLPLSSCRWTGQKEVAPLGDGCRRARVQQSPSGRLHWFEGFSHKLQSVYLSSCFIL